MENPEKLTIAKLITVLKKNEVPMLNKRQRKSYYVDLYKENVLKPNVAEFSSEESEIDDFSHLNHKENVENLPDDGLQSESVQDSTEPHNLAKAQDLVDKEMKSSGGFSDGENEKLPRVIIRDIRKYHENSLKKYQTEEIEEKKLNQSANNNSEKEVESINDNSVTTETQDEHHVIEESFQYEQTITGESVPVQSVRKRNVAAFMAKTSDTKNVRLIKSDFSVCATIMKFIFFIFIIILTFLMFILVHVALEIYAKEMEANISN